MEPGQWLRSVQTWACLGIARHRDDEPWHGSTRRRVLTDLTDGPEDWVMETACNALVASAWADPTARTDVAALVAERFLAAAERFLAAAERFLAAAERFLAAAERFLAAAEAQRTRTVTILDSLAGLVLAYPAMLQEVAGLTRPPRRPGASGVWRAGASRPAPGAARTLAAEETGLTGDRVGALVHLGRYGRWPADVGPCRPLAARTGRPP